MPAVSVIVPVYNVEKYLRECMDSIVRQTLRDLEIICVNDGSTDGSYDILQRYAEEDGRIVLINQKNGGYGKAMNAGLDRATGDYVGIVEPDDYVALTMFEDLYAKARSLDLDIVKADFYKFETDQTSKRTLQYTKLSRTSEGYEEVFRPREKKESFFYVMNTWSGIYRRSFLEAYKIRHNETPGASFQDNGFWFQTFVHAERVMILPVPYYRLRRDNPNSSVNNPLKIYAVNVEYDYIRGLLKREPEIWEEVKGVYWRKRYHNYDATMKRIDPLFLEEYRKQIAKELKWGLKRGEFSDHDFPENEWRIVLGIMNGVNSAGESPLAGELELIKNSRSYKLGRALTLIPRVIRDRVKGVKEA